MHISRAKNILADNLARGARSSPSSMFCAIPLLRFGFPNQEVYFLSLVLMLLKTKLSLLDKVYSTLYGSTLAYCLRFKGFYTQVRGSDPRLCNFFQIIGCKFSRVPEYCRRSCLLCSSIAERAYPSSISYMKNHPSIQVFRGELQHRIIMWSCSSILHMLQI